MPKSLSDTRWAARANAVQHVKDNFDCYRDALGVLIADNPGASLLLVRYFGDHESRN